MSRDSLKLRSHTKIILFLELSIIYINSLLSFLLIINTYLIRNIYQNANSKSFLFTVRSRILNDIYFGDITQASDFRFINSIDGGCPTNYDTHLFFSVKKFLNVSLTDVTDIINLIDREKIKEKLFIKYFPQLYDSKLYEFFLDREGNNTINFKNYNSIYSWKKKVFCTLRIKLDPDYSAFRFLPISLNCSNIPDVGYYKEIIECGVYQKTYKLCIIKDLLNVDYLGTNVNKTLLNGTYVCPLNDFELSYTKNPKYDINDDNSIKYILNINLYKLIQGNMRWIQKDSNNLYSLIDPYLTFDNYYYNLTDPNIDLVLSPDYPDYERGTVSFIQPFGIRDSFVTVADKYDFFEFFNETYSKDQEIINYNENLNSSSYITHLTTQFLVDESGQKLYRPKYYQDEKKKFYINLGKFTFPAFSKNCYLYVFSSLPKYDILTNLNNMTLRVFNETLDTIVAWELSLLFIYFWGYIKIRASLIMSTLRLQLNELDLKSDNITKLTLKFANLIVLSLLFSGIYTQKTVLEKAYSLSSQLVEHNCFKQEILVNIVKLKELSLSLDSTNNNLYIIFMVIFFLEFISSILNYVYSKLDNNPIIDEKHH